MRPTGRSLASLSGNGRPTKSRSTATVVDSRSSYGWQTSISHWSIVRSVSEWLDPGIGRGWCASRILTLDVRRVLPITWRGGMTPRSQTHLLHRSVKPDTLEVGDHVDYDTDASQAHREDRDRLHPARTGAAMLLLPGPGLVTIAIGLAILSAEFVWARRWLERMKRHVGTTRDLVRGRWKGVSLRGKVAQKVRGE